MIAYLATGPRGIVRSPDGLYAMTSWPGVGQGGQEEAPARDLDTGTEDGQGVNMEHESDHTGDGLDELAERIDAQINGPDPNEDPRPWWHKDLWAGEDPADA